MITLLKSWGEAPWASSSSSVWSLVSARRVSTLQSKTMQVGDRVLLQMHGKDPFMTKALHPDHHTVLPLGRIEHSDIIGRKSRDTVKTNRGADVRAYLPTLGEHVTMTPRVVTPVYPADANFMVSLLDIHVEAQHDVAEPPMEILEAGTGHASLTLHLARAIHAANVSTGPVVAPANLTHDDGRAQDAEEGTGKQPDIGRRQAVIHTVDAHESTSQHARRVVVDGFRSGFYARDIEFHVGDVSAWIDQQISHRGLWSTDVGRRTFLSHVILDMPNAHHHIEKAASVLHVDGGLLVFNPSITQIMSVIHLVKQRFLPLHLDRVLELGPYMTGGKEWDVRSVKPKAVIRAEEAEAVLLAKRERISEIDSSRVEINEPSVRHDDRYQMVCRPKVGYLVQGGGFVGFFRKMKH